MRSANTLQIRSEVSHLLSLRNAQEIKRDNLGAQIITSYVPAICISCLTCRYARHTIYISRKDAHKGRVAGSMTSRRRERATLYTVSARRSDSNAATAATAAASACLPPEGNSLGSYSLRQLSSYLYHTEWRIQNATTASALRR